MMNKKEKKIKLTPEQDAILALARHAEYCPYNEYRVFDSVASILGLKVSKNKVNKKK